MGIGAFGAVYEAEVRLKLSNKKTKVAVKVAHKDLDSVQIQTLVDELKIMMYLGEHLNIVNILGACTKTIIKGNYSLKIVMGTSEI